MGERVEERERGWVREEEGGNNDRRISLIVPVGVDHEMER